MKDRSQIQVQDKDLGMVISTLVNHGIEFDAERFDNKTWIIKIR
jgi:hypothetical protein